MFVHILQLGYYSYTEYQIHVLLLGVSGKRNIYGKIYLVLYSELLGSLERDIGDSEPVGIAIDSTAGVWHSTYRSRPVAFRK